MLRSDAGPDWLRRRGQHRVPVRRVAHLARLHPHRRALPRHPGVRAQEKGRKKNNSAWNGIRTRATGLTCSAMPSGLETPVQAEAMVRQSGLQLQPVDVTAILY